MKHLGIVFQVSITSTQESNAGGSWIGSRPWLQTVLGGLGLNGDILSQKRLMNGVLRVYSHWRYTRKKKTVDCYFDV